MLWIIYLSTTKDVVNGRFISQPGLRFTGLEDSRLISKSGRRVQGRTWPATYSVHPGHGSRIDRSRKSYVSHLRWNDFQMWEVKSTKMSMDVRVQ